MIVGNKKMDGSKIIKDYNINLNFILKEIDNTKKFTKGMSFEDFDKNDLTKYATTYNFTLIGEILKKIPSEIKKEFETKEYKEVVKFIETLPRYWEVNYKKEWDLIQNELLELEKQIKEVKE
jgi:uncharacterized protein with HEPN domain